MEVDTMTVASQVKQTLASLKGARGQGIQMFFITYFHLSSESAGNPTVAVLVILTVLLTGFGVFDHIAQWAGAGTIIPVTGFANTMASAAIDHRSEVLFWV